MSGTDRSVSGGMAGPDGVCECDTLEPEAERDRYRAALERIAAPKRPDGTYNLSREACEQIAANALRGDR